MKTGFYIKLASANLQKNRRLYLPHILTGAGLIAVFYILLTLSMDNRLSQVRGGAYLPTIMQYGVYIMGLLSVILILYTNSFLMKQRKREFGLYNILGLEKRHVGRILFFETLLSALWILGGGLIAGVILYKLCALMICRILAVDSVLGFYHISPVTLIPSALLFAFLYLVTYLWNRLQIARMKPVELLHSTSVGEKEPKIKWPFLVIGIAALGAGYYIALTTESPLKALLLFFAAVLLVILGTYCLFVSGTIALLKLLKSRPRFYYQKRHMIAVSGLLYRMKQNAVGLASIAILASGVLVMVSTTVSMYAGIQDTLRRQYPHQLYLSASYTADDGESIAIPTDALLAMTEEAASDNGLEIVFAQDQHYLQVSYLYRDGAFLTDQDDSELRALAENGSLDNIGVCTFMTSQEYEALTGIPVTLASANETACYEAPGNIHPLGESYSLGEDVYQVAERLDQFPVSMAAYSLMSRFGIVVKDDSVLEAIYEAQLAEYGDYASLMDHCLVMDFSDIDGAYESDSPFASQLRDSIRSYAEAQPDSSGSSRITTSWDSRPDMEENLYGLNGTLLFLGLILTFVFLFATALIIYYKQISEGYEDRNRFQIMQKVGMSSDEVKRTIHSQILLVFFLPLLVAAVHISVAFPILTKILSVLFLPNHTLFLLCTIGAFAAFAVIYVIIYSMTARIYYQIVR